jgi:hypothetical protein
MRTENYENHGLLDHNVRCFKDAVTEVFEMQRTHFQRDNHRNGDANAALST